MDKKLICVLIIMCFCIPNVLAVQTTELYESPTGLDYYSFDGINNEIIVPHSTSLNISSQLSISLWVKFESNNAFERIIAKSHTSGTQPYSMFALTRVGGTYHPSESSGQIRLELAQGGAQHIIHTVSKPSVGEWVNIIATYNGSMPKLYYNGVLETEGQGIWNSNNSSYVVMSGDIDTNAQNLSIGSDGLGTASNYFNGSIDEIKIWNITLNDTDIQQIYNRGLRNESDFLEKISNLKAYFPLNDSSVIDYSGNSNTGAIDGATFIQNYNNPKTIQNLTFFKNQNKTYWLIVNKNANVTSASLKISSILYEITERDAESSYSCSGTFSTSYPCSKAVDESWTSLSYTRGGNDSNIIEVYTKAESDPLIANPQLELYGYYANSIASDCWSYLEIYFWNYILGDWEFLTYSNNQTILTEGGWGSGIFCGTFTNADLRFNRTLPAYATNGQEIKTKVVFVGKNSRTNPPNDAWYGESKVRWQSSVTNSSITLDSSIIWNYTGSFTSEETTADFKTILNTSINLGNCNCIGCVLNSNNCSIPLIFHSDTLGIMKFSDIAISWLEYENPKISISSPSGSYDSTAIPYVINTSDNWGVETCKYWVTRGASIEIDNTTVPCSAQITGNAYVSSIGTNYTFHAFIQDYSGNSNYSSSNFSVSSGGVIILPPSGGGGGSSVVVSGEKAWTMEAGNGAKFEADMSKGQTREFTLNFENLGTTSRTINLYCQDVTGSICQYVEFPENPFELALLKDTKQAVKFKIILPESMEMGDYTLNIRALDDQSRDGAVTLLLGVGTLSLIPAFINKVLLNSSQLGIPYWLIFFPIFIFTWIFSARIIFKKKYPFRPFWLIGTSLLFAILSVSFI